MVLDLNRDGKVELKNATYFDLNANGFHEFTRWIDKTGAFLVLDKNFNGKADDGSELFGDAMALSDGSVAPTASTPSGCTIPTETGRSTPPTRSTPR